MSETPIEKAQAASWGHLTEAERSAYFTLLARRSVLLRQGKPKEAAAIDIGRPLVHGQRSTYTVRGCRCDECRAAQAAYMRARSRRR